MRIRLHERLRFALEDLQEPGRDHGRDFVLRLLDRLQDRRISICELSARLGDKDIPKISDALQRPVIRR